MPGFFVSCRASIIMHDALWYSSLLNRPWKINSDPPQSSPIGIVFNSTERLEPLLSLRSRLHA